VVFGRVLLVGKLLGATKGIGRSIPLINVIG
jgi:hypothetical protein